MTAPKISLRNEIYRKLIHLSSLWMVGAIYFFERPIVILLFSFLTIGLLTFEYGRRNIKLIKNMTSQYMGHILRAHENKHFTGAFYVVLAVLLINLIFDKNIALVSVSIMLVSDSFAAIIGKKYGQIKILDKSLEGSFAFFISAFYILQFSEYFNLISLNIAYIIVIAAIVSLIELISSKIKIDDNLSIVMASGLLIYAFSVGV
jgi:dolichol kinase